MGLRHGTTTGYARGCRCDDCRAASAAYQRKRHEAKKAGTWQPGRVVIERKQCSGPECDRLARYLVPQPLCGGHMQQLGRSQPLTSLRRYRRTANGMKECRLCAKTMPVESFYRQTGAKRQSACIDCTAIDSRARRYGLTFAETKELMTEPRCAGCGRELEGRRLFIDHDHNTGKVRGVLCPPCNTILMEHATPELLRRLADFIT